MLIFPNHDHIRLKQVALHQPPPSDPSTSPQKSGVLSAFPGNGGDELSDDSDDGEEGLRDKVGQKREKNRVKPAEYPY